MKIYTLKCLKTKKQKKTKTATVPDTGTNNRKGQAGQSDVKPSGFVRVSKSAEQTVT